MLQAHRVSQPLHICKPSVRNRSCACYQIAPIQSRFRLLRNLGHSPKIWQSFPLNQSLHSHPSFVLERWHQIRQIQVEQIEYLSYLRVELCSQQRQVLAPNSDSYRPPRHLSDHQLPAECVQGAQRASKSHRYLQVRDPVTETDLLRIQWF